MSESIKRLNDLRLAEVEAELLKCCGSTKWARTLATARPFADADDLFAKADAACDSLNDQDWLEAFRAHPKIGGKKAEATQSEQEKKWSAQEQSTVSSAGAQTLADLAQRNGEYEDRFGFIFIVCASGKSPEEMLAILDSRINNDRRSEIRIAAGEQRKITHLRLEKLLNS